MTPILYLVLALIAVLCVVGFVAAGFLFWQQFQMLIKGKPPFVAIPHEVLQDIVKALQLKPGDVLFDLGCGDGRVLAAALESEPNIHVIGIDFDPSATFLARRNLKTALEQNTAEIIRGDMFEQDFRRATVVFTYLFPDFMNKLLPKLEQELRPGTRLVSSDFVFSGKEPETVIDLGRPKGKLGRVLRVYKF